MFGFGSLIELRTNIDAVPRCLDCTSLPPPTLTILPIKIHRKRERPEVRRYEGRSASSVPRRH
jgi:hypothetical protein